MGQIQQMEARTASSDQNPGYCWYRESYLSNEKNPGWLGYTGDYTTQVYGDYDV